MIELPLLRVRYAAKFAAALEQLGARSGPYLEAANIDPRVLGFVDHFMPASQLHRFLQAAVDDTGLTQLGLAAGLSPRQRHSDFSREVAVSPTLTDSLTTVISNAKSEDGTASFELMQKRDLVWLCCGTIDGPAEAVRQVETYRYGALLEIMRYATGPRWLPPRVRFQSERDIGVAASPSLKGVDVEYGSTELAIAIPPYLLDHAIEPGQKLGRFMRPKSARRLVAPLSYRDSVVEVIKTNMLVDRFRVSDLADCVGSSSRSLQRTLTAHGLTFSSLLEEARIESARSLLEEDSLKLADIAARLGYRHSTHFCRAFKRHCGLPPGRYRLEHRP